MHAATGSARRSSAFLDLLRSLKNTPGSSRVGFLAKPASDAAKRHVGLVAAFGRVDSKAIAAAAEAGADAIEVRIAGLADLRSLGDLPKRLGKPIGLAVAATIDASLAEAGVEAGVDWLRFALETPFLAASWERPTRLLAVSPDLDIRLTPGINGLPIDAVLITAPNTRPSSDLDFGAATRLRALAEALRKPILVDAGLGISVESVFACEHLGADALFVAVEGANAGEVIAAYCKGLEALGSPSS